MNPGVQNILFLKTQQGACTLDTVDTAVAYILDMFSEIYSELLGWILEKQWEVLVVIASEGKAKDITSKAFAKRHHLQTVNVVMVAVRGLLEEDFITYAMSVYMVSDPFFALWLKK